MLYKVAITMEFCAAHSLDVPSGHMCATLHGHTYTVTVTLARRREEMIKDWVEDYAVMEEYWNKYVAPILDQKNLDNIPQLPSRTCEGIAAWIFEQYRLRWGNMAYSVKVAPRGRHYVELIREVT